MSSPTAKCPFGVKDPAVAADLKPNEGPAKCSWDPVNCPSQKSPHQHLPLNPPPKIGESILDFIGNTPMVRLNAIPKAEGIECEMLAKCEYFNAGGSVKDRIGKRMILDAEKSGRIKPGDVLIEPTSGNTNRNGAYCSCSWIPHDHHPS